MREASSTIAIGTWWTPHVENDAMPRLLDRFNLFMNSACPDGEAGCAVLSDITRQAWTPDDFIDEGHLSAKGNLAFARFIAPHVQAIGKLTLHQTRLRVQITR